MTEYVYSVVRAVCWVPIQFFKYILRPVLWDAIHQLTREWRGAGRWEARVLIAIAMFLNFVVIGLGPALLSLYLVADVALGLAIVWGCLYFSLFLTSIALPEM